MTTFVDDDIVVFIDDVCFDNDGDKALHSNWNPPMLLRRVFGPEGFKKQPPTLGAAGAKIQKCCMFRCF